MNADQLSQCKAEYYGTLAIHESLHEILNQNGGIILARIGSHPMWPARFSEPGEFAKMYRHRTRKGQLCVYFFGTRNYGWVSRMSIAPFTEDLSFLKTPKKYSPAIVQRAIDALAEAKLILDNTDPPNMRFFDRIMERQDEPVDMPCELCNRVDDHFSMLILCDGKDCKREFHMSCLRPPLLKVPPGEWFCPECSKTVSKKTKGNRDVETEEAASPLISVENGNSKKGEEAPKRMKKEKGKMKEGSLKRKLPSAGREKGVGESEGVAETVPKKSRGQPRATVAQPVAPNVSPPKQGSRPSTPVSGVRPSSGPGKKTASSRPDNQSSSQSQEEDVERIGVGSDERCLICGYGGELVVCEFFGCTKVYHQFCLGAFSYPNDDDATWFCPRHICALSGVKEVVEDADTITTKSPRKGIVKKQLWKCSTCPVALTDDKMPSLPKSHILSKPNKIFLCGHCSPNAPVKVQLAKTLEKIWSMIATNRQGLPFCGPLLPGLDSAKGRKSAGKAHLFRLLGKIRRLEYNDSAAFTRDIGNVVKDALEIIQDRSKPLAESAKTLKIICDEQMNIRQSKLTLLTNKIIRLKSANKPERSLEVALLGPPGGDKTSWPVQWRKECGSFDEKFYPTIEAKSIAEWTAYVTGARLYANCDELSDVTRADSSSIVLEHGVPGIRDRYDDVQLESSEGQDRGADEDRDFSHLAHRRGLPGFPGLTLSEGTDVMVALAELSKRSGSGVKRFGGWQEHELEEVDGRDFFLSPSISEMQQMFDQQSALLRHALESHSALQRAWLVSKQKLLGLGDGVGFSIGEGRLAAELRLANKNLRARLRNKDKLVDELTTEHGKLRAEVEALQSELSKTKDHASSLKSMVATTKNSNSSCGEYCQNSDTPDDSGVSSSESTPSGRKPPRNMGNASSGSATAAPKAKIGGKASQKLPRRVTERFK